MRHYERSGYESWRAAFPALACAQLALGSDDGTLAAIENWRTSVPGGQTVFEIAVLAVGGHAKEADAPDAGPAAHVVPRAGLNVVSLAGLAAVASAAIALSLESTLTEVLPVIDDLVEHGVIVSVGWPTYLPGLGADVAAHARPARRRHARHRQPADATEL